jgi:hypothetical protein
MWKKIWGVLVVAAILLLGGCQKKGIDTTTGPEGPGTGIISVRMTDAPGAYDAIYIAVDSVRVHLDTGDDMSGWYTISTFPAVYNLLDFTNGKDTIIAEAPVPTGYYSQIRLYIGEGSNIVDNGSPQPLTIPSGSQSGLKLNVQANILPGVKYVVYFDFDAARSIVVTGNGRYLLKPVIKVITNAASGSLSGTVAPDTTFATLWAITGEDTTTTLADLAGNFKFNYLTPSSYTLEIIPTDPDYKDSTITNVFVVAAQNTDLGTIVLQKK